MVLDGREEVRKEVGAVRRGVQAGEKLLGRAVGGGVDKVGGPRERSGAGCGSRVGRDRAMKSCRGGGRKSGTDDRNSDKGRGRRILAVTLRLSGW